MPIDRPGETGPPEDGDNHRRGRRDRRVEPHIDGSPLASFEIAPDSDADAEADQDTEPDTDGETVEGDDLERATGWDAPGVVDHPDRPDPEDIRLSDQRRHHILDGDPDGPGGGHRHGTGRPLKTEYPAHWDDETTCAHVLDDVLDVATNPDESPVYQQFNQRWRVTGTREDVTITAIVKADGQVWTAWPHEGSPGVTKNPEEEPP